ncbi:DUF1491 family protein [Sphingomonas sp. PB2P19]|uniref:DUF1491 family protein n=1 Tax=Sphingomonas rhamnosi TaxID=3096156 RepID=UPI002FCB3F74
MSGRLPANMLATALLRRVNDSGGFGMVLAKGTTDGSILVIALERGTAPKLLERGLGPDGRTVLIDSTPADDPDGYWRRRRARDPDLWVIEVDIADAERFAAETILGD